MAVLVAIVLVFIFAGCMAYRSWSKLRPGKRALAIMLLVPHFLLILCFMANLSCGNGAVGSACYTRQFVSSILAVFFLPIPSLIGTAAAIGIFLTAG
jgi:hypothetical protein